jgi:Phosphatidylglycerophosphate synthase
MSLFNLPNSLTLLRFLLVPFFTYFFLTGQYRIALIIFLVTGFTDLIDGGLARWLNKKTTLGAVLDPAADKFLMTVSFIVLALRSWVPWWLTCLVIFRDFWIISGVGVLKKLKRKLYFSPTRLSKLNTFFQLLTILVSLGVAMLTSENHPAFQRHLPWLGQLLSAFIYATAAMTILTLIQYTRIGYMLLKGRRDYADLPVKENKAGL